MRNLFITTFGKSISLFSRLANKGAGSTWPGHIALTIQKDYIKNLLKDSPLQIILIAGTNGKTTTGKILTTILEKNNKKVFQNNSGANLLNGIASSLLLHTNFAGKLTADYAIFEVDENNLPIVLDQLTPKAIIVLDLFRDQLDRYGELDSIAKKWQEAFEKLSSSTQLILNADDPLVAYLGFQNKSNSFVILNEREESYSSVIPAKAGIQKSRSPIKSRMTAKNIFYFGLDQTTQESQKLQHAADSLYCPSCNTRLIFQKIFYSHLGIWGCPHCKLERPLPHLAQSFFPLEGTYNKYNTLAATLAAESLGLEKKNIQQALRMVSPAFGRQEKLIVNGKHVQIFLSKNPTSFNESLKTILQLNSLPLLSGEGKGEVLSKKTNTINILFVLNDRIPDGRDVSWIWDIDMEDYIEKFKQIIISGDRTYDMALRLQYSQKAQITPNNPNSPRCFLEPTLKQALQKALDQTPSTETLYILPTYSAMLEVRKILTGKKIL